MVQIVFKENVIRRQEKRREKRKGEGEGRSREVK
jgi:hypothetical protein